MENAIDEPKAETKKERFKLNDKVRLKNKVWYGAKRIWIITYIYKNGDIVLRNVNKEDETIERFEPEELIKIDKKLVKECKSGEHEIKNYVCIKCGLRRGSK